MSTTTTQTAAGADTASLSNALPISLDQVPKLDLLQAGHLRHFHNLSMQLDGCWRHMESEDPGQELFDAYRFQIANMVYAASLAHYHRLPALRGVFKPLIRRLIQKMLTRAVWGYWYNTSSGSKFLDPDLTKLRQPWADPVVRENIMYSGHLLLMTSLYTMLFDDDEYEKPGSMVFNWDPRFWGLGSETFSYSMNDLQRIILTEMEQNGWLGVCCEPNVVFVVCNQFPLIAVRYNDVRNGTKLIDDVLVKYMEAWQNKGMVQDDGFLTWMWRKKQDSTMQSPDLSLTAWAATFLHSWNSGLVKSLFEKQSVGYITNMNGNVRLRPASVARRIRQLVSQEPEKYQPDSAKTITSAVESAKENAAPMEKAMDKSPTFGYITQMLSELGHEDLLSGLLKYADQMLRPTWEDGGLFYPRHDEQGLQDWTYMDPYTGNTAIAYARLNVPDGQKKMFESPWTRETLAGRPYFGDVDLSLGVDFLRAAWMEDRKALVMTVRSWDRKSHHFAPRVNNLGAGRWGFYINGQLHRLFTCEAGHSVSQLVEIGEDGETDLVWLRSEI